MYLVLDIGGTNTRIASSLDGQTLTNTKIIKTEPDFEQAIQKICQTVKDIVGSEQIEVAVGGIPGIIDQNKSTLLSSPHLQQWIQRPIKKELETNFDAPVYLENDSHLGGLGEACFGAGKGYEIVAYIAIGTGIGGVRIVNQKIDKNSFGFEPGHQIISLDGSNCDCGGKGHLETYVAGAYLEKIYGMRAENIKDQTIWDEISKNLAVGLNNTLVHWSADVLILSGSTAQKIPLEKIKSYLNQFLKIFPAPQIFKGTLRQEAGLYGALKLVQSVIE